MIFRSILVICLVIVSNAGSAQESVKNELIKTLKQVDPRIDSKTAESLSISAVAIPIAHGKRLAEGITKTLYLKIIQRAATIFAVGILMSAIAFFNFADTTIPYALKILIVLAYSAALFLYLWDKKTTALIVAGVTAAVVTVFWLAGYIVVPYNVGMMRIPGVLQRIAVCYLIVSLIFIHTNWRQQSIIGVALLLIYWLLMSVVPVPGCEVTTIYDKACNLAAWLDRTILTENHIWRSAKVPPMSHD